ncbi:transglutaminase-like cysteine peptidase [Sinorhizobium alkalisoli]|uniref:transglutaminase-like cysteine peptidase n=1 Tax=Sinorhizobium alkalisoli TaxID=1752398 RepID=UPI0009F742D3|nr:transglutaminase-like cysteine peptidase [Sinorhizobium alkalisoli]MCA1491768.1 transglutaminase-like cysteine peptidase [Ensifer sp. NBAIM29]MCG5479238.1 transglutaminase-like cysteine peptidase [Sinorhizobium alkalisoli]
MKRFIAPTAFLLLILAPGGAGAGTIMKTAGRAFAPPAFKPFCASEPRLCKTGGGAKAVSLSEARAAELKQVNRAVNARIEERSDLSTSGRDDDWRLPTRYGDCEDFAILKKHELLARGWPASALLLTVARYQGQGHTVLTVRTSEGDLVLDNLTNSIRDWSRTPYSYFARQSQADGRRWELIAGPERVAQVRQRPDAQRPPHVSTAAFNRR